MEANRIIPGRSKALSLGCPLLRTGLPGPQQTAVSCASGSGRGSPSRGLGDAQCLRTTAIVQTLDSCAFVCVFFPAWSVILKIK